MSIAPDHIAMPIADAVTRTLTATSASDRIEPAKRAIAGLWGLIPPAERQKFIQRIDPETKSGFWEPPQRWASVEDKVLDAAAYNWWRIAEYYAGTKGFEAEFVRDTHARMNDPKKKFIPPSEKQREMMKGIYRRWRSKQ